MVATVLACGAASAVLAGYNGQLDHTRGIRLQLRRAVQRACAAVKRPTSRPAPPPTGYASADAARNARQN